MTDWKWHLKAQESIAQSYLTNSKRPESLVKGVYPTHMAHGKGCWLFDHKGKRYLDFICGLGTNLLGYSNDRLVSAVSAVLQNGWSHSLGTHHEVETAEILKQTFPFVDCFKFLKSGSEATHAAVRMARAATGRLHVKSEGYHAWHDAFVSLTPPATGVPPHPHISLLRDGDDLSDCAAVIVEPVITDHSDKRRRWLSDLRHRCTAAGCLLIFDEVITGFRWPKFSVSSYWNITPDLICLGKAIAGGLPLAAVGGKYAVMNGEYFVSSSYAGEILSLAAAKETARILLSRQDISLLWDKGRAFQDRFNSFWPEGVTIEGYPTRGVLKGETLNKALFMQEACKAGMLFGPSWFWSFPAAEVAPDALGAIGSIMQRIKNGEVTLEGQLPSSPFAQKVREAR